LVSSALCFVLALAAKTQAIIFLPPLLLLWGVQGWHRPAKLLQAAFASTGLLVALLAPFIWWSWKSYLPRIIEINLHAAETYTKLSLNCYNIWYLIGPEAPPITVEDLTPFAGLTYRAWGLLLFFFFSAVALLPLLTASMRELYAHNSVAPAQNSNDSARGTALVLLSCGIIPLLFAFFNTQMHDRYWHAAILFLAGYGFLRSDYWPYVLASSAYFLNLESVLRFLQLKNYKVLVFSPWFVASLFAATILLVLWRIYQLAWQHTLERRRMPIQATAVGAAS
jgi:hypothetical protein